LLGLVITGFKTMFGGYGGFSFLTLVMGLGIIIGGGIATRIFCELLIVIFKIHENLKIVADKQMSGS
jgi:hypothetical protein